MRVSRLHPDLDAFLNHSRNCYFELKHPASKTKTSTTLSPYPYWCTTVLENTEHVKHLLPSPDWELPARAAAWLGRIGYVRLRQTCRPGNGDEPTYVGG